MQMIKKMTAAVVAVTMVASLSSCANTEWAAKTDKETVTSGMYIGMLVNSYNEAKSKVEKQDENVFKQKIDDTDAKTWIKNKTEKSTAQYFGVNAKFEEMKLEIPQEEMDTLNANMKSYWEYLKPMYEDNGCGKESYLNINMNTTKSGKVFEAIYAAKGTNPVPDEEIQKYFTEEYVKFKMIPLQLKDANGKPLADEKKAEVKKLAESYLTRLNAGESIDDLIKENAALQKAQQAAENPTTPETPEEEQTPEPETKPEDNEAFLPKTDKQYPEAFRTAVFAAEVNKPFIAEDEDYIIVSNRMDINGNKASVETYRAQIIFALKSDEFNAEMQKLGESQPGYAVNKAAFNRYSPKNIKEPKQ